MSRFAAAYEGSREWLFLPTRVSSRLWPGRIRRQLSGSARLHLGCGDNILPGWENLDIAGPGQVRHFDLTRPLPVGDASIDFVFTEHFIEHVSRTEAARLVGDIHRVLRRGGILRISTPDLRHLVDEYLAGRIDEWADVGWAPRTSASLLNEGLRSWGHQFLYDEAELRLLLGEAGFACVTRVAWHDSEHTALRDLECRPFHGDLIIEATK